MADELSGKVAIVTGGAKGIGRATAELFVAEGAKVVIADLDAQNGAALASHLGGSARFLRTDVSVRADLEALVDDAVSAFQGLDIMVNNAGFPGAFHDRFLDDPLDDFDKVMRINLAGVMYGSQITAREMVKAGGGSIINTTSTGGVTAGYSLSAYRAAKAGVINLTRSLAIDLGEYGIRVNGLAPGRIPTGMSAFAEPGLSEQAQAELKARLDEVWMATQPLRRRASPSDVANAALFLGSDRSLHVTGQILAVDGGVTAGDPHNLVATLQKARETFLQSQD
ncbi:SDR family NAD(P)-dependent oxidoreductase [Henriciella aquimarina]|uniref:SDR family NAD(P)-dependent oxidoreductase n=1 Tax=Henriciella aquimarina TaxID=545261 RepID=UPI0009FE0FF7|nr:glucose 1-dehydrogenase [Henriciella aquimarina]